MAASFFWQSTDQYSQVIKYVAGKDLEEYICECHPKNQHRHDEAVWRISKIAYDGTDRVTSITWADRSKDFAFICDDAATYNYDD